MATRSAIIARIAQRLVGVGTIKVVYAPAASGVVQRLPDDIGLTLPAALLLPGDSPVIPGNWERQSWDLNGRVYVRDVPRGERYQELSDLTDDIIAVFRVPDVTPVDPAVQSVLLTEIGAITGEQWQRGDSAPWYLVLPFTVQVKVNRSVTYGPA